jgi:hypothetical protein
MMLTDANCQEEWVRLLSGAIKLGGNVVYQTTDEDFILGTVE